ncbi:MAG: TIGR03086 family metal-binding protein [Actinomycetota bacterium]|nr:TIGR03086 family metal-binding protein [Actinomycetota bacterium]
MSDDALRVAADHHRLVAGTFSEKVNGAAPDAWDRQSPVKAWVARDVVRHLTEWSASFLESGAGVRLAAGPSVDEDPVAAWHVHREAIQSLLEDPAAADRVFTNEHIGELPLYQAIERFYTPDVFMHTWDLARATGQDETLDPQRCAAMFAGMEPLDEMLRASGQYGPRVEVPDDADPQTKLLAFIGRDPR